MDTLIKYLLQKGDSVAARNGQLLIEPKSRKPVPKSWLNLHSDKMIVELAQHLNQSIYAYSYYQTGNFNQGRLPGVILKFIDLLTGEDVYAIFNADLKRKRTNKLGRKGEPLPTGQFHVGERSALYKLWLKTGFKRPRRLSELNKSLSKLKCIYFIADRTKDTKLINNSIQPLTLSSSSISHIFGGRQGANKWQENGKLVASNKGNTLGQGLAASDSDKDLAAECTTANLTYSSKCMLNEVRVLKNAGEITAYVANHALSNQVMTRNVTPFALDKKLPKEQTNAEWLEDYDSAGKNKLAQKTGNFK
jgi:hypothetical protein